MRDLPYNETAVLWDRRGELQRRRVTYARPGHSMGPARADSEWASATAPWDRATRQRAIRTPPRAVRMSKTGKLWFLATLGVLLFPNYAHAYIGPGAGFALAGSFFAVFLALLFGFLMVVTWPVRWFARVLFGRRPPAQSRFKRVVVLGLDGLDYGLTERLLSEGKLPHMAALRDRGCFETTGDYGPAHLAGRLVFLPDRGQSG